MSQRRRCLEQLLTLGQRQADLIAVGNMADLMRLLSGKQQLIIALQSLERELGPYHEEEPESRRWSSTEQRTRCAADADHCRRLIVEVMALEQAGERQLTVRRDETAVQLRNVNAVGRVREAYQSQR
jgi:hypothetical protein